MSMTPLERWLAVLRREKPDRVPMDYWGTNDFTLQLMTHLDCPNKQDHPRTAPRRLRGETQGGLRRPAAAPRAGRLRLPVFVHRARGRGV